jgi:hypothetical protein
MYKFQLSLFRVFQAPDIPTEEVVFRHSSQNPFLFGQGKPPLRCAKTHVICILSET